MSSFTYANAVYYDVLNVLMPVCVGKKIMFLNTIRDCILQKGSPGMIKVLSTLFVQAGVTQPVNGIEQICRCRGDTVKCLQIMP